MKAIEQCFPVVLFIMLHKMVLTFESVNEILKCDCLNEKLNRNCVAHMLRYKNRNKYIVFALKMA